MTRIDKRLWTLLTRIPTLTLILTPILVLVCLAWNPGPLPCRPRLPDTRQYEKDEKKGDGEWIAELRVGVGFAAVA